MKKSLLIQQKPYQWFLHNKKQKTLMRGLILCCMMFLTTFGPVYAQQEVKLNLNMKNATVEKVVGEIKKQSNFDFIYDANMISKLPRVTLDVKDATIESVLEACLKGTKVWYKIDKNVIMLVPSKEVHPKTNPEKKEKKLEINGKVTDKDGIPLPGATVLEEETMNGVIADNNGDFKILVASPTSVLRFSHVGFEVKQIMVGNQTQINVVLGEATSMLGEVVVTGYQTLESSRSAGAFDFIGSQEIENRPTANLATAMEGMFAGLRVYENAGSTQFSVRGLGTMTTAVSSPLIVVDGFPVTELSTVNPNDVESIHVLKDASAASIWGARASNGVIVITTKKAKSGLHVSVNSFLDFKNKMDLDQVNPIASSEDALTWEKFLWDNDLIFSSFSLSDHVDGNNNPASFGITLLNMRDEGKISQTEFTERWNALKEIDYKDDVYEYLLQNPVTQNYDLTIDGKTERNNFVFNAKYVVSKSGSKKTNSESLLLNLRNTYDVLPWLTARISIMTKFVSNNNSGATLGEIRSLSPYERLVDNNGDFVPVVGSHYQDFVETQGQYFPYDWNYNLLQETQNRELKSEQNDIRIQAGLSFKIIKGLSFDTKFQYEHYNYESNNYYSLESYHVRDQLNKWIDFDPITNEVLETFIPEGGQLNQSYSKYKSYNFRNQINYNQTFGKNLITAGVFSEMYSKVYESYGAPTIYGYDPDLLTSTVPNVYFPITSYWGASSYEVSGMNSSKSYSNDRFFSLLGNFAYTYNDKYSITASFRVDASNLIVDDPKERYSPFWSIGGNWQMHKEDFIKDIKAIDRLNVRLSYGRTGNVVLSTSKVPLISIAGLYPLTNASYGTISDYGNPSLTWEKTRTFNFGIDYSFFNHKLFGSLEIYKKHGVDIIGSVDIPRVTGSTTQSFNTAEIENKGFELSIGTELPINSDISWRSNLNLSYNKSEVLDLLLLNFTSYSLRSPHFEEGKPVEALYSYTYLGLDEENIPYLQGIDDGTFTFNENEPVTTDDREFMEYSGSRQPTVVLGWQNAFSAYGFNLSFIINGEFGHVFRCPTFSYPILSNSKESSMLHSDLSSVLDNTAVDIPTMPPGDVANLNNWGIYAQFSNGTIEKADNIRVKEINLSYNLPQKFLSKIKLKNARVYFQIRDPKITWFANDRGLDPMYIYNSPGSSAQAATIYAKPSTSYKFGFAIDF